MVNRTYMGIPREEIPWYPTIDPDLCSNCGACMDFCSNNVFAHGELHTEVVNPYNCVVGCSACQKECETGAILFPSKEELIKILNELREKYKSTIQ